jgi:hypothetical protein
MPNFMFVFEPVGYSKTAITRGEFVQSERISYAVSETTYHRAIKKLLKLRIPEITNASDVALVEVNEEEETIKEPKGQSA